MSDRVGHKPLSKYRCTQSELYAICNIGWNSFKEHVNEFTKLKGFYTIDYANERLAEVEVAFNLPDYSNRYSESEAIRVGMIKKADECLGKWQILKRYILEAFSKEYHKLHLDSAGIEFYNQSAAYNWEVIFALMRSGSQFIETHMAELLANNNMPAGFKAEFDLVLVELFEMYQQFFEAMSQAKEITSLKINANNDIYEKLMRMFKDAQQIFRHEPGIRQRYIFTHVLARVSRKNSPEENTDGENIG